MHACMHVYSIQNHFRCTYNYMIIIIENNYFDDNYGTLSIIMVDYNYYDLNLS